MYKLHYPRLIVSMLKEPPILKMVFVLRGMILRRTTFAFKYLGEFEMEIKNILGHESGAHMGLIHEKNQRPKISCYSTFNPCLFDYSTNISILCSSATKRTRELGSLSLRITS
jgi:hypothetical protein